MAFLKAFSLELAVVWFYLLKLTYTFFSLKKTLVKQTSNDIEKYKESDSKLYYYFIMLANNEYLTCLNKNNCDITDSINLVKKHREALKIMRCPNE